MFGKMKEGDGRMETLIGTESHFQGTVRSKGSIRVDGRVEGGVSADSVFIGETGEIQGDITAKTIVVGGKVTGNIIASTTLELQARSQVYGDLRTAQLIISEGAVFEGNCVMTTEKTKVIEVEQMLPKASSARS
jgi:cytoskeletal protein CcmA (bactofilin family)